MKRRPFIFGSIAALVAAALPRPALANGGIVRDAPFLTPGESGCEVFHSGVSATHVVITIHGPSIGEDEFRLAVYRSVREARFFRGESGSEFVRFVPAGPSK